LSGIVQVGKRLAVRSPQCAQIGHCAVVIEKGMNRVVARQRGESVDLSVVVYAVSQAEAPSQCAEVNDRVASRRGVLYRVVFLSRGWRGKHCERQAEARKAKRLCYRTIEFHFSFLLEDVADWHWKDENVA